MQDPVPLRPDEGLERLPPNNIEAEEAVLGSVLLDRAVIEQVASILGPKDFYRERNSLVYAAMLALYERDTPVDYITLTDELDRTQKMALAGGITFLSSLLVAVPTPIHAVEYANVVARMAYMRRLISAGGKIAAIGFGDRDEPDIALERAQELLYEVTSRKTGGSFKPWADVLRTYMEDLASIGTEGGSRMGLPTGFLDLDKITGGGLQRSDLVILAARPGMGKTSMALALAVNAAVDMRMPVAMFSLEMSATQLAARLISTASGIGTTRLRSSALTDQEVRKLGEATNLLAPMTLWIDDSPTKSIVKMRDQIRDLVRQQPVELVIVDHIQLVTSGRGGDNRVNEMSEVARQLKAIARDLNVPVVALSQLSRGVTLRQDKRPILSDLRDSGGIEENADLVIFLHRDDYYNKDSEKAGMVDLLIAKHRNGPTGEISLLFNQRTMRFMDLEYFAP